MIDLKDYDFTAFEGGIKFELRKKTSSKYPHRIFKTKKNKIIYFYDVGGADGFGLSRVETDASGKTFFFSCGDKEIASSDFTRGAAAICFFAMATGKNQIETNLDMSSVGETLNEILVEKIEGKGDVKSFATAFSVFLRDGTERARLAVSEIGYSFGSFLGRFVDRALTQGAARLVLASALGLGSLVALPEGAIAHEDVEATASIEGEVLDGDGAFELSDVQRENIDPRILPFVQEFIKMINDRKLRTKGLERLSAIRVIPDQELFEKLDGHEKQKQAVALTVLVDDATSPTEMFLAQSLLRNRAELKGFVIHELLHVVGYSHPHKHCTWRQTGCGIMGESDPTRPLSLGEVNRVINRTLDEDFLRKSPKIPFKNRD